MAADIQDHFHLMATLPDAGELTNEWESTAEGGIRPTMIPEEMIFASPKYSITGQLYTHVLLDGADPVQKKNWAFETSLNDYADMLTWLEFAGKEMYFVPHYHDQADHQSYSTYVFVQQVLEPRVVGVQYDQIDVPVRLLER